MSGVDRQLSARAGAYERLTASGPIVIPDDLPIADSAAEIIEAIRHHPVIVVAGETGSGKSTQLPKLCLAAGRGVSGLIGHTQPRRVAARTVAERIASELDTKIGAAVGYTVRFDDRVGDETLLQVMTDGVLLNAIQRDQTLRRYDTLIIDEAHERSLNIDFILGFLKQLLPRRPDLRVIVTSATIDTERFAQHFSDPTSGQPAPVFNVEGRTYPVEIRYRPFGTDNDPPDQRDQVQAVIDAVSELAGVDDGRGDGDILVFLSGEREIRDTADALRDEHQRSGLGGPNFEVLPLYSRLSSNEQHRIFSPHRGRRVVVSTNIAETSLTVPSVRYVIDTGVARISRYSRRLKVQRLPIEEISQASANQRSGRSGRVAPGIAIRLYDEQNFNDRPAFTDPEILRTNLASVILQMTAIGLGDVTRFPFLEPPDTAQIRDGYQLLNELGALKAGRIGAPNKLTKTGRALARLPVDPRLARMIIEADRQHCVREVLIITAGLSIQDVRERPKQHAAQAGELHARFKVPGSDLLSIVELWNYLGKQQRALSGNQFRHLCRDEYLHYVRVREWRDLYSQLRQVAGQLNIRPHQTTAHPDNVHQAILAGLLSQIGERGETGNEFRGARDSRFVISRQSALSRKPPAWVMAAELVETNRLWAHRLAAIQPEWCEPLAQHLVKRSYGEARWQSNDGRAVTDETVTLYGRPIITNRTVGVGRINAQLAREMFIRHALVAHDWDGRSRGLHEYLEHNQRFLERVDRLQARIRRTDLIDDQALFEFFDERIPEDVVDGRTFEQWWQAARNMQPQQLDFNAAVLSNRAGIELSDFPDRWVTPTGEYPVTYRFQPDTPLDGASIAVPVALVNELDTSSLDWLVPGYRPDLVAAMVRSLPKQVRRDLIPMNATVTAAVEHLRAHYPTPQGSFAAAVADSIAASKGRQIDPGLLETDQLPSYLRFHIIVTNDQGELIDAGDDLAAIQQRQAGVARAALQQLSPMEPRNGITAWDFGSLDPVIEQRSTTGHVLRAYPTLLDRGDSVTLRVVDNPSLQQRAMKGGVRRLLLLAGAPTPLKVKRMLTSAQQLSIAAAEADLDQLADQSVAAALDSIIDRRGLPWNEADFAALNKQVGEHALGLATDILAEAADILEVTNRLHKRLVVLTAPALEPLTVDAAAHRDRLLAGNFIGRAGPARLPDVHRYLRGIEYRLDRLNGEIAKDERRIGQVRPIESAYVRGVAELDSVSDAVREIAWMIEEYRLSIFAPAVGVAGTVSPKTIRQAWHQATGTELNF